MLGPELDIVGVVLYAFKDAVPVRIPPPAIQANSRAPRAARCPAASRDRGERVIKIAA
jgi:hypothetical protein